MGRITFPIGKSDCLLHLAIHIDLLFFNGNGNGTLMTLMLRNADLYGLKNQRQSAFKDPRHPRAIVIERG